MFKEINNEVFHQNYPKIIFDETVHRYTVGGEILPSVSEIMRPLSEQYYADIPASVMEKARDRGTQVHKSVEMFEVFGVMPTSKEIIPYVLGYKMAKSLEKFQPIASEIMLTNGEFCGTLDMIAMRDVMVIIDLKATSKINYELIEVQLAGYLELCLANFKPIEKCFVLHLKPNTYKFTEIIPNYDLWNTLKGQWHSEHLQG